MYVEKELAGNKNRINSKIGAPFKAWGHTHKVPVYKGVGFP